MIRMREWLLAVFALVLVVGLTPALVGEEKRARDQAAETVQGQVQNVAADQHQFVLKDQNGREWTLHIGRDAKVQVNGKDSRLADLKEGDQVTVTCVRMARDIRSAQKGQGAQVIHGQIKRVEADQHQLIVKDHQGKDRMIQVARDAHIRSGDKDQQLANLKEGEEVVVIGDQEGETLTAHVIRAHPRGQGSHVAQGEVQSVAADQHQLVLKDKNGKERRFQIGQDARVHLAGKEGKLADLKEGDPVNVIFRLVVREVRSERKNP